MTIKKILLAAILGTTLIGAAQATVINADFTKYATGTKVSNQINGVIFSLKGGVSSTGNPTINNGGLSNSNNNFYPTASILDIDFIGVASGVSFTMDNQGTSSDGRGKTFYSAFDSLGHVIETGFVGSGGTFTLHASDIADLQINNNASGTDSWIFAVNNLHANVPEPTSIALLGLGLFCLGVSRRRKQK